MAQQTGYSPSFKRPAEIFRLRRKRARSEAAVLSNSQRDFTDTSPGQSGSSPRIFSPEPRCNDQNLSRISGIKRRNPFGNRENTCSPQNKRFIFGEDDGNSLKKLNWTGSEDTCSGSWTKKVLSEDDSVSEVDEQHVTSPLLKAVVPSSITPPSCTEYPVDWSLKTRLLVTSPLSLSWAEQPKAQEEALGLSHSCRAQFSSLPCDPQDPRFCSELRSAFQQCLVYWQHPSLPWLSLFPRINAKKTFSVNSTPWAHDATLQKSLMREWSVSLSSLYSLLKAGLCPYFYVCSYQFTVLFRAAGLGGSDCITALVSPTTWGLREAMKSEGIEFSLPLVEERKKNIKQQNTDHLGEEEEHKEKTETCCNLKEEEDCQSDELKDDGYSRDNDDSFLWLKDMGLQDKIKKSDGINIQLHKEAPLSLDHKPESVVCVEGSHTFSLINFLINCKSLVAAAGSQTGLPPTLLAPTAFRGATMNMLKGCSVNVKTQVGSTYQNISSLEIAGPILPSSLHAIISLLHLAQKGNFSAALYTHAPTAVLNVNASKQQSTSRLTDVTGFGLSPASSRHLEQPSTLGKTALTHICTKNYNYTWKS